MYYVTPGGLRFGEMEKDALTAHGAAFMTQDKLVDCSDGYWAFICKFCGQLADAPLKNRGAYCRSCKSFDSPARVKMPYAFKLLWQEISAMGVHMHPKLEPI
jgi:DNA-directed RNA polymerase I subunit RPA2